MEKRSVRTFDQYITSINKKKIYWVRFDQKVGYVLVDWVRFDQKSGYVLTKIGYVLVGYVLAWVRFDLHPISLGYDFSWVRFLLISIETAEVIKLPTPF